MFGFLLKKNFWDTWDNLWHVVVLNMFMNLIVCICFSAYLFGVTRIPLSFGFKTLIAMVAIFLFFGIISMFNFAECDNYKSIANYNKATFKDYFKKIGKYWKDGMLFGFICAAIFLGAYISFPYYFHIWKPGTTSDGTPIQGEVWGLILAILVFWFIFMVILLLQWVVPVKSLFKVNFRKALKKSLIILLDNMGFSICLLLWNIVLLFLSVFTLGLVPGSIGIPLSAVNALKLRLLKYDYIEQMAAMGEEVKRIPWDELLQQDRETLGPRTLKEFFFPWKDSESKKSNKD